MRLIISELLPIKIPDLLMYLIIFQTFKKYVVKRKKIIFSTFYHFQKTVQENKIVAKTNHIFNCLLVKL